MTCRIPVPAPAKGVTELSFPYVSGFKEEFQAQIVDATRIFVLGIGMDWKCDDRLGSTLTRALIKVLPPIPRLTVFDGGECPENYTGPIREFAPSHVVLLDAVDMGLEPGVAFLAEERDITMHDLTSHRLPLKLFMRFLRESLPCRVILVGVQPKSLEFKKRLSAPVQRTVAPLAYFLSQALQEVLKAE